MTVRSALRSARDRLAAAGVSSPDLDAALLLAQTLGVRRERLALEPERLLAEAERARFEDLVGDRARRVPMAQILGRAEFWSLDFKVTKDTLSPRPETEMLVEEAVKALRDVASPVVVDIGTGTGCIAIAIAKEVPSAVVHAVDLSPAALAVARENVRRHGLETRIHLHLGDMFAPLVGVLAPGSVDVVVSNPPYVRRDEEFDLEILHEPAMALFVDDVPGIYRRIAEEAAGFVRFDGTLFMELPGLTSWPAVYAARSCGHWQNLVFASDLGGLPRVLGGTRTAWLGRCVPGEGYGERDRYQCPCCGFLTFDERTPGTLEICDVCFWQDDMVGFNDPMSAVGPNAVGLYEARRSFKTIGACESRFVDCCRNPLPEERVSRR